MIFIKLEIQDFADSVMVKFLSELIYQYRHHSYSSITKAARLWLKNRDYAYSFVPQAKWAEFKTSDTIFLFGSGPSVNDITSAQWQIIQKNDSFGLNYVFLTKQPMTYFYLGYEPSSNQILSQSFKKEYRRIYSNSLWFVPTKVFYRLTHPRTVPEFFPYNPMIAKFSIPPAIIIRNGQSFTKNDFEKSLLYRGCIGIGLHMACLLDYKKIVLMGIDLHTYKHFYDDFEVM